MGLNNGKSKRSEKGLLTPDNCVVALIDHQPQMLFGTSNFDRQEIINNTVALGKAALVFDVPVVLTTVETKSFSGNLWPQIRAAFPGREPIERSFMNSWDDKNFVAAIEKTGRKKIVLCGLWTETCVALPTVQAIHDGYEIYVVEDCCGDVTQLAHDNAMKRVIQAGAKPASLRSQPCWTGSVTATRSRMTKQSDRLSHDHRFAGNLERSAIQNSRLRLPRGQFDHSRHYESAACTLGNAPLSELTYGQTDKAVVS